MEGHRRINSPTRGGGGYQEPTGGGCSNDRRLPGGTQEAPQKGCYTRGLFDPGEDMALEGVALGDVAYLMQDKGRKKENWKRGERKESHRSGTEL